MIPLLLPGVEPAALALWFDEEPVGVRVQLATGAMSEALPQILTALGEQLPEDVELAQPAELRERIKELGVFYCGAYLGVMMQVLEIDEDTARNIAIALIEVGLGEDMGYGHLRLDPALPAYLLGQMSVEEQEQARARWADGMEQLANFLYRQQFKDAHLAAQLTLLDLQNLLALLQWSQDQVPPEQIVDIAGKVEHLLSRLDRPQALAEASRVREQAARALLGWSHAHYLTESASIDRLLERRDMQAAYNAAQQLLQRCLAAGEAAYSVAVYDIAMVYWRLGRVLQTGGAAEAALQPLDEARHRFEALVNAGDASAERMVSATITDIADCLRDLGRLDEAATAYEACIKNAEKRDDKRSIAANKFQLGTVRVFQRRYAEALKIYAEARDMFESLGEPRSVATARHQIGIVHREAGQFELAEWAYRQSLAMKVQLKDLAGESTSLNELGLLYTAMTRLEEAVAFYRQAIDISVKLQDLNGEGRCRYNLADTLIRLQRFDDARTELYRAIECDKPYGHAAEPWKTWIILHDLERATSNPQAAAQARQQAIQSYLAYRRDGGENQNPGAKLCALVAQAIQQGDPTQAEQTLSRYLGPDAKPWAKAMIPKLQAILHGSRDPALADDPALEYDDAAEVLLLLERLNREGAE